MQSAPTPPAAPLDAATATLSRLVTTISEDMIFAIAGGDTSSAVLDGLAKRRAESYAAVLEQKILPTMTGSFDAWLAELVKAVAPVSPPVWLPMGEVIAEKVTLEVGARGLRSLFSSKPSEKDVQRVKRLGTLAVRALRATFAADGNIDAEEARTIGVLIGAFGLPHADAAPLYTEPVVAMDTLDVYGDIDAGVARALVRGAWHAAAWDAIDPREEQVIRKFAAKLDVGPDEVEAARASATARIEARRLAGLAAVDAVRFVLSDRVPGTGVQVAADVGMLMLPRRYREEALAQVGHGAPVTLAKRYADLPAESRSAVLCLSWAAALHDDPTIARQALLRVRHDHFAADLGDRGDHARELVTEWVEETLQAAVSLAP